MQDKNQDAMEYIWDRIPKTKEGKIHYLPGDIPYLYNNGFVDAVRYTYEQWKSAFEDSKQSDGTYLVGRDKFMSLRPFRYVGQVFQPFDAKKVREGEWTDENLEKLYQKSIKPSSSISHEVFWNSIKALKKQPGLMAPNGNLLVSQKVKTQLAYLIERFPSPRRRLEKEVSRIRETRETEVNKVKKERDSSLFTAGKLASESKMEKLAALQSSSTQTTTSQAPASPDAGIDIKKLRRPSGKITG